MKKLEMQQFTIEGRLPALNDYVRACRANRFFAHQMKQQAAEQVAWAVRLAHLKPMNGPVAVGFHWYEQNKKRDMDNIAFAKKFILDVLQPQTSKNPYGAGILDGDGWKHVDGFTDTFDVDKEHPRIVVTIVEVVR